MTPREEQLAKIEKLKKTLSTLRPNQVKLRISLEKKLATAERDLRMYDKFRLESDELKAKKRI